MPTGKELEKISKILREIGLTEYQSKVLAYSYSLGVATAPEISRASKVSKAKIYTILEELVDLRLMKKISTNPLSFEPQKPETAHENLMERKKISYEKEIKKLEVFKNSINVLNDFYDSGLKTKTREAFMEILRVGISSELETRKLYRSAKREVCVTTRAFEYFPKVRDEFVDATKRGIEIKVLMLNNEFMDERSISTQNQMRKMIEELGGRVKISKEKIPIRMTLIDPSKDYSHGKVLFLVEEENVPVFMRSAAISENSSLVYGLSQYFDFLWEEVE